MLHMCTVFRGFVSWSEREMPVLCGFTCVCGGGGGRGEGLCLFYCFFYTRTFLGILTFIIKSQKFDFTCPSWVLEINLFKQKQNKTMRFHERFPIWLWSWAGCVSAGSTGSNSHKASSESWNSSHKCVSLCLKLNRLVELSFRKTMSQPLRKKRYIFFFVCEKALQ